MAKARVTQAQIQRAIRAGLEAGLRVKSINPVTGTVPVDSGNSGASVRQIERELDESIWAADDRWDKA